MANSNTPITNLQQLKDWLSTQTPGGPVTLSSAMFNAPMVQKLFELMPGTTSITIDKADIDVNNAILSGPGSIMGESNCTIKFKFTQPTTKLLCELSIDLPADVKWSLIDSLKLAFAQLKATLVPNDELSIVNMSLSSVIEAGDNVNIPVKLTIPSFDGDWLLASGEVNVGALTEQALLALSGDANLLEILPDDMRKLEKFVIQSFEMKFNVQKQTCSFIRIIIRYDGNWEFFNKQFLVESIVLDFEVFEPFNKDRYFHGTLLANMNIAQSIPLQVGGQFPDQVIFARLQPNQSLQLTQAFRFFKVDLPEGFPDIEISTLGFAFYVETKSFNFKLGITKQIPIAGKIALDNLFFEIGGDFNPVTNKMEPYGAIRTEFSIGKTKLILAAEYKSGQGVEIYGEIRDLHIKDLTDKLKEGFEVEVPGFIESIILKKLVVIYNTASGNFTFLSSGSLMVAESEMTIDLSLKVIKEGDGFNKKIDAGGKLTYKEQVFKIDFTKSSAGTAFTATWDDTGKTPALSVNNIADLLGLAGEMPTIPPDLNEVLSLNGISFTYDTSSTHKAFLLTAKSTKLGKADFVALNNDKTNNQWQFFFGMATGKLIDLADLPVLDKVTTIEQGKLAIESIQVNIASITVDKPIGDAVNAIIDKYAPDKTYPKVPAIGMTDRVAFTMMVNIGGNKIPIGLGAAGKNNLLPQTASIVAYQPVPEQIGTGNTQVIWFDLQKNFGPLYFDKIGLGYKDSHIFVLVNVMATASGLSIALNGFGVGVGIKNFDIAFNIDGVSVTYASDPILLSAGFQGTFKPVNLVGSFLIKTPPITIGGIGGYTEVDNRPSMFLYALLNAPIGGPAFFFVKGLAAGFGYNRKLVMPDITGVNTFPFVVWAMGGSGTPEPPNPNGNVAEQVNKVLGELVLKGTVAPQAGNSWIAAGIRFTSFELVDSFALLSVSFGTSVEINLLGLSRLTVPMGAGGATGMPVVAFAELAIKATYSQSKSLVSIEGQLTKNSFVLAQACHLTGGFAFYFWFGGDFEGDFVITLGGYNALFTPPKHYPRVPRLGLNWQVVPDTLSIKGELYFAVTSNAVMAGGLLSAVWQSGGIKAWFTVQADFLIMFKPFHYDIRAAVDIGASFTINLFFTSITLTINVGATLHIWGPEFAGEATIHLYIISFTISFGAKDGNNKPKTIDWREFSKQMLPQKKDSTNPLLAKDATTPDPDVCKLVVEAGLLKQLSEKEGEINWIVNPEKFVLSTQSIIPSKTWKFSNQISLVQPGPDDPKPNIEFGVRPVGIDNKNFSSEHSIVITSTTDSTFHALFILKNVPKALWEKINFDANGNPILGNPVKDTTVPNVVSGFTLVPYVAAPGHTLPIPIQYLQFKLDPNIQKFWWSTPFVPTTDNVQNETVYGSIKNARATHNRDLLLQAIINNDVAVDEGIDVDGLGEQSTSYLLAEPLMRLLGEEKN